MSGETQLVPIDWSQVSEEILCPLCDYNLRGLAEPRCPECGYRFEWNDLLDINRRRHPYLFEHHPRRNLWSFFKTLRGGLKPRTFWTSLWPGQRSEPRRLALYALLMTLSLLLLPLCSLISDGLSETREILKRRAMWIREYRIITSSAQTATDPRQQVNHPFSRFVGKPAAFQVWLDRACPLPPSRAFFNQWADRWQWQLTNLQYGSSRQQLLLIFFLPATLLFWPWLTFLALMVFQSSMFNARVKTIHVLRCIIYCGDVAFWIALAAVVSVIAGTILVLGSRGNMAHWSPDQFAPWLALPFVAIFIYRMAIAYKRYLQFDWPVATILTSQIIVTLIAFILLLWTVL